MSNRPTRTFEVNTEEMRCIRCGVQGKDHPKPYPSQTILPNSEYPDGGGIYFGCMTSEEKDDFLVAVIAAEGKAKDANG